MNIKSLLLGSAAVFAVAGAAHAADAIVAAEPEPLEYVRICDAYGVGYFYIPGSETCLKISGKVRTEGQWGDAYGKYGGAGTWNTGTLWRDPRRSRPRHGDGHRVRRPEDQRRHALGMAGRWQSTTDEACCSPIFSLGGFTVGKLDSQYIFYTDYAGNVANDDVIY